MTVNKHIRNTLIVSGGTLVLAIIWALIKGNFVVGLLDSLFFLGLIEGIVGGFMFLAEKGMFKIASYTLKRVRGMFNQKDREYVEEKLQEMKGDKKLTLKKHMEEPAPEFTSTYPILISGIGYCVITFLLSMFWL